MADIDPEHLPPHLIPEIYQQVGAITHSIDDDRGEGTLEIRPALRCLAGPSAAALAVFLQDLSAVTISRFAPLNVPIVINVRMRGRAAGVGKIAGRANTLRRGRTVMALESTFTDADDPTVALGNATGSWAAMDSYLATPRPTRIGPGTPSDDEPDGIRDFDDLLLAVGGRPRSNGGVVLDEISAGATEPIALGGTSTGTLHAGALQVLAENAAVAAARAEVGDSVAERLVIEGLSTQFLSPARVTPISAVATVIAADERGVDCRVEVRESDGEGRLSAVSYARFGAL